jgi:HK97 gp10 family phage protein
MFSYEVSIEGLSDLQKVLQELPVEIEKRLLRAALRKAWLIVIEELRDRAPVGRTGRLRDSIRLEMRLRRSGVIFARAIVGGTKQVWYAHLIEYGVRPHTIETLEGKRGLRLSPNVWRRAVSHPGFSGRAFIRNAFDAKAPIAAKKFRDEMLAGLLRWIKRTERKLKKLR